MKCRQIQDRLEAFVENDLSEAERKAVEDHLRGCADCHKQWMQAKEVLEALQALPLKECPAHIVREVLKRTRTEPSVMGDLRSFLSPLFRPVWRPVVGLALIVALLLILLPLSNLRTPEPPIYSEQEIRKAQEEIRWTLAYLHRTMTRTQSIIREEVISDRVVRPIRDSMNTAIESIREGGGKS